MIRAEGKLSQAAKMLHTSVAVISRIIDENPDIVNEMHVCHNELYEEALSSAKDLLDMRHPNMTKFVLENLGEKRGFATKKKVEISGDANNPLKIEKTIDLSNLSEEELLKIIEVTNKLKVEEGIEDNI